MPQVFENDKIRVTVSDAVVESFLEDAEWAARRSSQTFEQALRGLILGVAMRKWASGIVARRLADNLPEPDPEITRDSAHTRLVWRWYEENGRLGTEPLQWLLARGRMPSFYRREYEAAQQWASEQLERGTEAAREAVAASEAAQRDLWESERRYREAIARMDGWEIEIKAPDAMPRQVGLVEV